MANPLNSKAVRGWLKTIADHEYFPLLIEWVEAHNRLRGWEQPTEWLEMKANGYRAAYDDMLTSIRLMGDENYSPIQEDRPEEVIHDGFEQIAGLPDHVSDRFN